MQKPKKPGLAKTDRQTDRQQPPQPSLLAKQTCNYLAYFSANMMKYVCVYHIFKSGVLDYKFKKINCLTN